MPVDPTPAPDHPAGAANGPAPAAPVAGEDALRVPMPPGVPRKPPPEVDLANIRPLLGSAVPARPQGRSFNLASLLDRMLEHDSKIIKLEDSQVKFFADCRKRLEAEIESLKACVQAAIDSVQDRAEARAREIASKIDERYADKFAKMDEAISVLTSGCAAMSEAHRLVAEAAEQSNAAAKKASVMAAKIDILAGKVDEVRNELGSDIGAVQSMAEAAIKTPRADAAAALKLANQSAKDLQAMNGRLTCMENWRKVQAQKGTGRR